MSKPAARQGDNHNCTQHGGKNICEGSSNVMINNLPAARQGDKAVCENGPKATINQGSGSILINGKPAARQGDTTDHNSTISSGSGNVKIGDSGKPVNIGSKGKVNIGGNGKSVTLGK